MSIGIAVSTPSTISADQLIKQADIALYQAKATGGASYRIFEPQMEVAITARHLLRTELARALSNNELELRYQPIVDLERRRVSTLEALLRWRHPYRGYVSPCDFIPLAEQTGLIHSIGAWAIQQACKDANNWPASINVAVNLSPCQFQHADLLGEVRAALEQSGLDARRLNLEITETVPAG